MNRNLFKVNVLLNEVVVFNTKVIAEFLGDELQNFRFHQ